MSDAYLAALATRRTHHAITNASSIPDEKLEVIIKQAVIHTPTAFNTQSGRAVLVTGAANTKLWNLISESALKGLEGEAKEIAIAKLTAFGGGYGSVMFFEDQAVIDEIAAKIPKYASHYSVWSTNSAGMLHIAVWTAFALEGLGASLQHSGAYSDELMRNIHKTFDLPSTWISTAIMPFGIPAGVPAAKTFLPIEDRVKTCSD
ncbi:nitroreductase-like oxidoreductase [Roridomyces roridus]|uniref:Nitroreductase-like oxidoreductase n=1 Tax=Roridomyces roridus TaxID=1738132 RepID=A0AAD7BPV3_9AGAR|nr:nitroreductase-like oxidoreductase [Roridomyces roridus]